MKTVFFSVVHNDFSVSSKTGDVYLYVAAVSNAETPVRLFAGMGLRVFVPRYGSLVHWTKRAS